MNQEWLGKHTMQCFRCAACHMCVFDKACADVCEYNCTPFPSRSIYKL